MPTYLLNPYLSFVESRLFPGVVQYAVFHRLTGEIFEPSENVRNWLLEIKSNGRASLNENEFNRLREHPEVSHLIQNQFLIPEGFDPLAPLLDYFVARPIQNPALAYRSKDGEVILVRTTMDQTVYSRKRDDLPPVIEEALSPLTAKIFLLADGTRTLRQIHETVNEETEFRSAIDFLTTQERQVIKLTKRSEDLDDPYSFLNIVPRNLYHADRKDQPRTDSASETIVDFHLHDIEDASWEFDQIEPTINHSFRFSHDALGGVDYGSRFCVSTLTPDVVPLLDHSSGLKVLEVGGGTGSFAVAFLKQASTLTDVDYHILDLSPALMKNQKKMLGELLPDSKHFQQDATAFDLPGQSFDLIVSNEVIADFPVAPLDRNPFGGWRGEGVEYAEKYDLLDHDMPDHFVVNAGVFRFIERAWQHLKPNGTLIVSEYGSVDHLPAASFNLNHDEYTIHFGHVVACATKIGFQCRLLTLKEYLDFDDEVLVLNGREEHILCLNHVLKNFGETLPYAVISKSEFEKLCGAVVEQTGLIGYSFSPLKTGYHFGPNLRDFFVLIMHKPE